MRTNEEVQAIIKKIQEELEWLPDVDIFGDSNVTVKEEMETWIRTLRRYLVTGDLPNKVVYPEVYNWVTGKNWSPLEDYT